MPDADQQAAEHWVERLFDKLLKFAGPILLAYIAVLGTRNTIKVDAVEAKQVEAAETTQAKTLVDEHRAAAAEVKSQDNARATAVNLYGTWLYLNDNAASPAEKAKAAEARATYDDFVKKNNLKK